MARTVRLPKELEDRLDALAAREDRPVAAVVTDALDRYAGRPSPRLTRTPLAPFAIQRDSLVWEAMSKVAA